MKKFVFTLITLFVTNLISAGISLGGPFLGPTEQEIKRESMEVIEKNLKEMNIQTGLLPFFDSIAAEENWGHIGYHGATQTYRIYQDIIRFTMEEILNIYIREDFQFLRVPGDRDLNLDSVNEFTSYWGENVNNRNPTRAKQLLSMNYGIYSNFGTLGSCSVSLFVNNQSITDFNYAQELYPFYKNLGIDPKNLDKLFSLGVKFLNRQGGILLQISENSHLTDPNHEAYNFADQQSYPAERGGYIYEYNLISVHFERIMSDQYVKGRVDISPQLRLLINNRFTLNPFSHLVVKRWDFFKKETIEAYEHEMRAYIRKLSFDSKRVEKYRNLLLSRW